MKNLRIIYFIKTLVVIALGLLARAGKDWLPDYINLYLGDALYAVMMFYIYSFILPGSKMLYRAGYALITCFSIEFLQLCDAPCIVAARATLPGRLILGQGFLWSDLAAYITGVGAVYSIENRLLKKYNPNNSLHNNKS